MYIIHVYTCILDCYLTRLDYADNGEYWRSWYEDPEFRQICEDLWQEVLPLYQELHAYTKHFLKEEYAANNADFPDEGHIPAHILGKVSEDNESTSPLFA